MNIWKNFWAWFDRAAIAVDAVVLNRVERAAGRIQMWTGYTCFAQARACYGVVALFYLFEIVIAARRSTESRLLLWIGLTGVPVYALGFGTQLLRAKRDSYEDLVTRLNELGLSNPLKALGASFRGAMTLFNVFWTVGLFRVVDWPILFTLPVIQLAVYLEACDSLPPGRGRIHEWLDALRRKPVRVEG